MKQCITQIVVRLRIIRFDFQGLLELGDGFVQPPLLEQDAAKIIAGLQEVGLDYQGGLKMRDGFVQPPLWSKAEPRSF